MDDPRFSEFTKDDFSALDELRGLCRGKESVSVRPTLFEKVEDLLNRWPDYEFLTDEDGNYLYDHKGRILRGDKIVYGSFLFCSNEHREVNFMFKGTVVLLEAN